MNPLFRRLLLLAFAVLPFAGTVQAQIYSEGFETDGEGTRYTSNTFIDCNNSDFFFRTNTNPVTPPTCSTFFSNTLVDLQGSFFWASEDIRTSTPVPNALPPGDITTQNINVAGYSSLTVSLYLATSANAGTRWESADSLNIQASLDGGSFVTVGRFMGKGTPTVGARLGIDINLDGAITGADPVSNCDTVAFRKYTFSIPGTGSTLRIKLDFDQVGGTEELAIDQIEVDGIVLPNPEINLLGNGTTILDGDSVPSAADFTDFGSQATCVGVVPHVFTIENTGTQTLTISGILFTGNSSDFAIVSNPSASVPAGSSTNFTMVFNPTANGLRTAVAHIINNDPDEGSYDFTVQGIGLADTISPAIQCPPSDTAIALSGTCDTVVTYAAATGTDNCGVPAISQLAGGASGSSFAVGITVNVFQASDGDGNTTTCAFAITVLDVEAPVAACQNITLFLNANGTATLTPVAVDSGGSTDNCGIDSMRVSPSAFTTADIGSNNVVLTVMDGSGNVDSCVAEVVVVDTFATAVEGSLGSGISWTVGPNPTDGILRVWIGCGACLEGDDLRLEVWGVDGRRMMSQAVVVRSGSVVEELDLGGLAAGHYYVALVYHGVALVRKVMRD